MKKILFAFLIVSFQFVFSFAQENQAVWQFYKSDADEFSAEFPSQARVSEIADSKAAKKTLGNLYKSYFNKTFYFIVTCRSNDCPQFEVINQLKFRARNSASSKFSEKSTDDAIVETRFGDTEGFFHVIRQVKSEKLLYILHSVSEFENSEEADRFLKSFQLKTANPDAQSFEKEKFDRLLAVDNVVIPLPQQPKTSNNPLQSVEQNAPLKTNIVTVPIKILNKPKANYTDVARIYEISGEVYLRIVFTANKSIGMITPLKKLPFGLTDEAIAAAKGINFEPALRDGKPYPVTKPVVYTFNIY